MTSLARLWQTQGRREHAFMALSAVYGTFTEGFTMPDLVDAANLLEKLGHERMRADFDAGLKYVRDCIPSPDRVSGSPLTALLTNAGMTAASRARGP